MKDYDVILASGAEHLKRRFEELGVRVFTCDLNYDDKRIFPNGDVYVRISDIEKLADRRVIVVQSCTGSSEVEKEPFTTADRLVELLLILDVLDKPARVEEIGHKQYKTTEIRPPKRIEVVLTFQPFALQDKAFKTGEAVSARWSMNEIASKCDKIWVINPHAPKSVDWMAQLQEENRLEIVDIKDELIAYAAQQFGFEDYLAITPDEGGQERFDLEGFGKRRKNSFTVELHGNLSVKGQDVIVVDDLTKSGSTLLKAAERLRAQGAKKVGLAVVHVLPLIDKGEMLLVQLLEKSNKRIVTSNTIRTRTFCEDNPRLTLNVVDPLVKIL